MLTIDVLKQTGQWEIWEHTPMAKNKIADYRYRYQAKLVAIFYAKMMAHNLRMPVELTIKNRLGQITEKNTYGYDPESSRG